MNVFNSLGSNYDLRFTLKALFTRSKESYNKNLKDFLEKKYDGRAILVYKGREAIALALNILKLSPMSSRGAEGDVAIPDRNDNSSYVAINGFTCYAVYKAIETAGYKAELIDLDNSKNANLSFRASVASRGISLKEISRQARNDKGKSLDLNFSAQSLSKAIKQNRKIKVVIVQNTLGFPCDIEGIVKVCRENNLILIEDLAHCVGTRYENGKEAGTIGDFVVFSFSQDKIIDAVSGGALIIRNTGKVALQGETLQGKTPSIRRQMTDRVYPLFTFLIRKTYQAGIGKSIHFALKALNLLSKPMNDDFYAKYNLPNWYSYLVMDAFANLKKNLEHRKQIVNIYNSMFDKKIAYPSTLRYSIFVKNRKSLIDYLEKQGVYVSDIWYDDVDKNLPNCQIAANVVLNLPTHINVSEQEAKNIAQKINQFFRHSGDPSDDGDSRISLAQSDERFWTSQNDGAEMNPTITTKLIDNKKEWEDFLSNRPESNFLQSWYWGEFYDNLGNKIQRTGFYKDDKLVGVMLSIIEQAKRGEHLIVPGGPIIDWKDNDVINAFVNEIKKIAKEKNCVFVRVRPQLLSNEFSKNLFKKYGFINAPMHLHAELTSQLDITKPEETLLANVRKTTRYEIKKAKAEEIKVTSSNDPSLIKEFYRLQIETAKRQKFVPFSFKYLLEQFKVFAANDKALLYKAEIKNKLLSVTFVIFYGREAVYHYGASTDEGRKYPGAYLIQWEAILEAKKRGCTRYNFWGVAPIDEPNHRFYGLSLFKRGFGGEDVEYLHAQDLIINYPKYLINYVIESIRKKVRGV